MINLFGPFLPLISLGLLLFGIRGRVRLENVVPASLAWTLQAVASLEILGLFGIINGQSLFFFWALSAIITGLWIARHDTPLAPGIVPDATFRSLAIALSAIVIITLVVGLLSPPNTADSIRYHIPRVEQWAQQASLENFPTMDDRQLASNPLAEMLILHFRLLSESERFHNLIQGLAFAGSVATAAVAARRLGAGTSAQILAAILIATLPMAILQGSSTQNDFVVSFFLLAAAERLLAWHASWRIQDGLGVGIAVALAVLTKGTAFFFAAPIGLVVLGIILHKRRWKDFAVATAMAGLILAINAPHLYRNAQVILVPNGLLRITASVDHSPGAIASSVLRNAASNFVTPWVPANDAMIEVVRKVHHIIGRDPDDQDTTLRESRFENLPRNILNGDVAPSPAHLLLILFAAGVASVEIIRQRGRATSWPTTIYLTAVVAGGLIFCALLRWQPFIVRLQLPFFILAAPAVAVILSARLNRTVQVAGSIVLLTAAIPFVICNQERPLYGNPARAFAKHFAPNILSADPWKLIFWDNPERHGAFQKAVESVRDRAHGGVGLIPYWDYGFWRMLKGVHFDSKIHIENVCLPEQYSTLYRYKPSQFQPTVVLTDLPQPRILRCSNGVFEWESSFPTDDLAPTQYVSVYRRRTE